MKTDSLFYYLFQTAPGIFFELIGQPDRSSQAYQFRSVELKQTAFRVDGVFVPSNDGPDQTVFFVEVQFQSDPYIYHRLFAEIFLYLQQNPQTVDWQAVVIYPRRSLEPEQTCLFRSLLGGNQVQRLYLNELTELNELEEHSLGVGLVQLITQTPQQATGQAKRLLEQVRQRPTTLRITAEVIMELVETILVYKFPNYSRQEIAAMLGMSDFIAELKQTRVYQEALEEGREEGREQGREEGREVGLEEGSRQATRSLILRQLERRFGPLSEPERSQVDQLFLPQLESLAEALLDFKFRTDLEIWLNQSTIQGASILAESKIEPVLSNTEEESGRLRREKIDKRNRTQDLINQSERQLREASQIFGFQFASDLRRQIETLIRELRDSVAQDDDRQIDLKYTALQEALYELAREMYQADQDYENDF